eukprot:2342935-Pleurochrysis_carterae.AAC.1
MKKRENERAWGMQRIQEMIKRACREGLHAVTVASHSEAQKARTVLNGERKSCYYRKSTAVNRRAQAHVQGVILRPQL